MGLARATLRSARQDERTVHDLAIALSYGNGAVRLGDSRRGLLVLGPPTSVMEPRSEGFRPVLASITMPHGPVGKAVGSTRFAARTWRQLSKAGLGDQRPEGYNKEWAPAARHSLAVVPIGGPLNRAVATSPDQTDDKNTYDWYDLSVVPVGGVVYRITSQRRIIALVCIGADDDTKGWVMLRGPASKDFGGFYAVARNFSGATTDTRLPRPVPFDRSTIWRQQRPQG